MRQFLTVALLCGAAAAAAGGCGGSDSDGGGGSASAAPGEQQFREYGCGSCHSLDGSERTGPTLEGLAGSTVKLQDGGEVTADRDYLKRSILEPDAQIVDGYSAGIMTAAVSGLDLESKPEDVDKLVDFIESVK